VNAATGPTTLTGHADHGLTLASSGPGLGISASVLPAERSRAAASGADAFIGKPFGVSELVDLLAGLAPGGETDAGPA